jgi:Sulfotransferase family
VIISHERRFIYVKTRKTASTSLEVFLASIAGDDAVVTPIHPELETHHPRNYERLQNPVRECVRRLRKRRIRPGPPFYNHVSARAIRWHVGSRIWDSYFTFTFERDPWEKTISRYYGQRALDRTKKDFRDYVLTEPLPSDFSLYSLDGVSVGVDFVGRYESLRRDLRGVLDHLGIGDEITLPVAKGSVRPRDATVASLYDPEMDARIESVFAKEISEFGYRRETPDAGARQRSGSRTA